VSTVRKSHSRMLAACRRRNSAQLCSSRFGAGSIAASLRIAQTVLAATSTPRPTSSPWIRRYPHAGFSPASRTTSSRISAAVAGRPGQRCGYVQRRATRSRCQRSSVAGVTNADLRHARRGSTRLSAANNARSACVKSGRATCRSSTRSWWRSSRISISFSRSERRRSTTSSSSRRTDQYTNDRTTPRERPATAADPTHQPTRRRKPNPIFRHLHGRHSMRAVLLQPADLNCADLNCIGLRCTSPVQKPDVRRLLAASSESDGDRQCQRRVLALHSSVRGLTDRRRLRIAAPQTSARRQALPQQSRSGQFVDLDVTATMEFRAGEDGTWPRSAGPPDAPARTLRARRILVVGVCCLVVSLALSRRRSTRSRSSPV
jgi:hypothetical protein